MPATRVLPTEEATALLELTRDIATRELLPGVTAGRGHRDLPARGVPHAGARGAAGPALPGGVRRGRPALRGLPPGGRGDRHRLGQRRRGRLGARALLLRPGHQGHRGAAAEVAARHAQRRAARRLLPLRAARRLRPLGDEDAGATRRRRVRPQRRKGVDHARRARRLLQGDGAHLGRAQRHLLLPGAGRLRGPHRRPARAQDGPDRVGDGDDAVRRRTHPCGASARRGGRRAEDRARRPRLRTARHRLGGGRAGPGGARPRGRLRQGAPAVRPADHRLPGAVVPARRHGGRRCRARGR